MKNSDGYWGGYAHGNVCFVGKYHTSTVTCSFVMKQELTFFMITRALCPTFQAANLMGIRSLLSTHIILPISFELACFLPVLCYVPKT